MANPLASFSIDVRSNSLDDRTQRSTFQIVSLIEWAKSLYAKMPNIICQPWALMIAVFLVIILAVSVGAASLHPQESNQKKNFISNEDALEVGIENEILELPGLATRQQVQSRSSDGGRKGPPLWPSYKTEAGVDVVWQIPKNPTAALFLAHGCNQKATMFWDKHPKCSLCSGMPEDRAITLAALKRDYAVIAIGSHGTCWRSDWPPQTSVDIGNVVRVITRWQKEHGLEALPLFALGASSGGYFVSVLAHALKIRALAVYISSGVRSALIADMKDGSKYPPTLFVHMPKDSRMTIAVTRSVADLKARNVQAAQLACEELPVHPLYFAERIPGINRTASEKIYGSLKLASLLDGHDFLKNNPRSRECNWRVALTQHNAIPTTENGVVALEAAISEELNVAFASHELTSLKMPETFEWFKNKCSYRGIVRHHRCVSYDRISIVNRSNSDY